MLAIGNSPEGKAECLSLDAARAWAGMRQQRLSFLLVGEYLDE
jgi:hypothetical protein